MLSHDSRTAAEDHPCEKGSDERVSESDPGGCKTELPSELTRVTYEDHGGEI